MGHGFRSYVKLPDGIYVSLFILQTNINGHWQQQDLECWQLAAHKFTRPKCCQNIQNGLLSSSDVKWCNGIRTRDLDYSIWYWRNRTTPSTWLFNSTIQVQSGTIWNHLEPSGTIWNQPNQSSKLWVSTFYRAAIEVVISLHRIAPPRPSWAPQGVMCVSCWMPWERDQGHSKSGPNTFQIKINLDGYWMRNKKRPNGLIHINYHQLFYVYI